MSSTRVRRVRRRTLSIVVGTGLLATTLAVTAALAAPPATAAAAPDVSVFYGGSGNAMGAFDLTVGGPGPSVSAARPQLLSDSAQGNALWMGLLGSTGDQIQEVNLPGAPTPTTGPAIPLPGLGKVGAPALSALFDTPDGTKVYAADANGGLVSVNVATSVVSGVLAGGYRIAAFASNPGTRYVYAVGVELSSGTPYALVLNPSNDAQVASIALPHSVAYPDAAVFDAATSTVDVLGTPGGDNNPNIVPIVVPSNTVGATIKPSLHENPMAMALSPDGQSAFVAVYAEDQGVGSLDQVAMTGPDAGSVQHSWSVAGEPTAVAVEAAPYEVFTSSYVPASTSVEVVPPATPGTSTSPSYLTEVNLSGSTPTVTPIDLPAGTNPSSLAIGPTAKPVTGLQVSLSAATASVAAGIRTVPLGHNGALPANGEDTVQNGATTTQNLAAAPLGSINLNAAPLSGAAAAPLGSIPLGSIPLGSIALGSIQAAAQGLAAVVLSNLPITYPAGCSDAACTGWAGLLKDSGSPLATRPLQSTTLADVVSDARADGVLQSLPVGSLDLAASKLGGVPLESLAVASIPLSSLPLSASDASAGLALHDWCTKLAAVGATCASLGITDPGPAPSPTANLYPNVSPLSLSLASLPLGSIPLGSIPLGSISLAGSPLGSIPLGSISLSSTPLGAIPLGAINLATSPLGSIPLGSIPLGSIPLGSIPLGSIPLGSIPLGSIPLGSIPLGSIPLGSITLSSIPAVSANPSSNPVVNCAATGVSCSAPSSSLAQAAAAGAVRSGAALSQLGVYGGTTLAQLAGAVSVTTLNATSLSQLGVYDNTTLGQLGTYGSTDVADVGFTGYGSLSASQVAALPLGSIPLGSIPLGSIPLGSIDLATSPLGSIPLGSIPLGSIPLGSIPLGSIRLDAVPLGTIPLSSIPNVGSIVNCSAASVSCVTSTLGQAQDLDAVKTSATLAQITSYNGTTLGQLAGATTDAHLAQTTLTQLGAYGSVSVGAVDPNGQTTLTQIQGYLQVLLEDILRALLPPSQYPWSNVDLANPALPLASADGGQLKLTATVTLAGNGALTNVGFAVPRGYVYVPGSARVNGTAAPDATTNGTTVTEAALLPIGNSSVEVTVRPNEVLGQAAVSATASAAGFTASSGTTNLLVTDPFAPNSAPGQALALPPDTLAASFVTGPGDVDYWSINVPAGDALALSLSNLPADYDMVLYGPPATQLQHPPAQTLAGVTEQTPATQSSSATVQLDAPNTGDVPLIAGEPVVGVSEHRGATSETIQTLPLAGGTYLVQVDGYNGAFSTTQPYILRAKLLSTPFSATCRAPAYPNAMGAAGTLPSSYPANVNTLFVVNEQRLAAAYGAAAETSIVNALSDAAGSGAGGMVGAVVPVDGDPATRTAYTGWDATPCSVSAANAVVGSIGQLVDGVVAAHPTVRNLVVVGADDQVPMGRVPDQTVQDNEAGYAAGTLTGFRDQLSSALSEGYFLSDDPYASPNPLGVGGVTLYTPQLALGRLVESPGQIIGALNRFVSTDGVLAAGSALSTGYDFLDSGANAIAANLAAGGSAMTKLIDTDASGAPWTAAELNTAIQGPNISSVSGHFDFGRTLSAAGNSASTNDVLDTAAVRADGSTAFTGRLLLSMGCHSGLNIPLNEVRDVLANGADSWTKVFADEGAVWIANTGYGYADTASLAYSARLLSDFAAGLDGSATIGQALANAKQRFAADTAVLDPYDLKASMESTFYGMPNYSLTGLKASPPPAPPALPVGVDPATQLPVAQVHLDLAQGTCPGQLSAQPGPTGGTYYQVNPVGVPDAACAAAQIAYNNQPSQLDVPGVQATGGYPLEPLVAIDVTQPPAGGSPPVAHGALITGLRSTDVGGTTPAIAPVQADLAAHEPAAPAGVTDFPAVLQRVTDYQLVQGPASTSHQQLDLLAGQYISTGNGVGIQRLYTGADASVLYTPASDTDFAAPTISQVDAFTGSTTNAKTVSFSVNVVPSSTAAASAVREVLVLFTGCAVTGPTCVVPAGASQSWTALQLQQDKGGSWVGGATAPATGHVAYMVQAVDGNGNVAVSTNKGAQFSDQSQSPQGNLTVGVTPLGTTATNGSFYTGPVNVTLSSAKGGTITYQVDTTTASGPSPLSFSLGDDGAHTITASDTSGDQVTTLVAIDTTAPTVSALVTSPHTYNPSTGTTSYGAGTTLRLTAADQGSGVASLTAAAPGQPTVQTAGPGPLAVSPPNGTTTYTVTAVDNVGNTSTTSVTLTVDSAAPTVTCPVSDSSWHTSNVSVSCSATDSQSGLATPPPYVLSTSVAANTSSTAAVTNSVKVCDNLGNCATAGPLGPYKVDLTTPTITVAANPSPTSPAVSVYPVNGPPPTLYVLNQQVPFAYTCADPGGSGIATCAATINGSALTSGAGLPTGQPGSVAVTITATSVAGATVTQTYGYTVTDGICGYTPGTSVAGQASLAFNLQLCDATGSNIGSSGTTVRATSVDGSQTPVGLVGNTFGYSSLTGTYSYSLVTTGIPAGSHTLWVGVAGDPVTHGLAFTVAPT